MSQITPKFLTTLFIVLSLISFQVCPVYAAQNLGSSAASAPGVNPDEVQAPAETFIPISGSLAATLAEMNNPLSQATNEQSTASITIEAEDALQPGADFSVIADAAASGGSAVFTDVSAYSSPDFSKGLSFVYQVSESATSDIVVRVKTPNGGANSFWYRINGGAAVVKHLPVNGNYHEVVIASDVAIAAGTFTLEIAAREDGTIIDYVDVPNLPVSTPAFTQQDLIDYVENNLLAGIQLSSIAGIDSGNGELIGVHAIESAYPGKQHVIVASTTLDPQGNPQILFQDDSNNVFSPLESLYIVDTGAIIWTIRSLGNDVHGFPRDYTMQVNSFEGGLLYEQPMPANPLVITDTPGSGIVVAADPDAHNPAGRALTLDVTANAVATVNDTGFVSQAFTNSLPRTNTNANFGFAPHAVNSAVVEQAVYQVNPPRYRVSVTDTVRYNSPGGMVETAVGNVDATADGTLLANVVYARRNIAVPGEFVEQYIEVYDTFTGQELRRIQVQHPGDLFENTVTSWTLLQGLGFPAAELTYPTGETEIYNLNTGELVTPLISLIEAEDVLVAGSNFSEISDADASGGSAVLTDVSAYSSPDFSKGLSFVYQVSQSATSDIVARVKTPNGGANSFWYRINGGPAVAKHLPVNGSFHEVVLASDVAMAAGTFTLEIAAREDGTILDYVDVPNLPAGSVPVLPEVAVVSSSVAQTRDNLDDFMTLLSNLGVTRFTRDDVLAMATDSGGRTPSGGVYAVSVLGNRVAVTYTGRVSSYTCTSGTCIPSSIGPRTAILFSENASDTAVLIEPSGIHPASSPFTTGYLEGIFTGFTADGNLVIEPRFAQIMGYDAGGNLVFYGDSILTS